MAKGFRPLDAEAARGKLKRGKPRKSKKNKYGLRRSGRKN